MKEEFLEVFLMILVDELIAIIYMIEDIDRFLVSSHDLGHLILLHIPDSLVCFKP